MIWFGWLFIGLIAFVATWMALTTSQDDVLILFGLVGFITWLLFAYQSLNVTESPSGVTIVHSYPALSMWALGMAVITGFAIIEGPIALIDQRGRAAEETAR